MSLPYVPLPTDVVQVAGQEVKVRGLSRAEVLAIQGRDYEWSDNYILACGAGVTEEEAREWRNAVPPDVGAAVVDRICELSGLVEGAQKSG